MKNINIPLSDEHWRTLKELAHANKMRGILPGSITRLILSALEFQMPNYRSDIASLRGARKGKV